MNKNIRNTTIFTLLLAVVFLNVTMDTHAAELADRAGLTSAIGTSAFSSIQNSGENAHLENNTQQSTSQNVNNSNEATVMQNVNAVANTGHNIAERNIAIGGNAGMISTGDASVVTAAQVQSNENDTVLKGTTGNNALSLSGVSNTGNDFSSNTADDTSRMTAVQNDNKTTVIQRVNATANTGENYAPRNISVGGQAGVIQTGNAYTGTSLLLAGNGNVALVGGESNGNGPGSGASVIMTNTGDRYRATDQFRNQSQTDIYNKNLLSVEQACYECTVNTGNNASNRNINTGGDAGVIQTGNAILAMSLGLQGNTNAARTSSIPTGNTPSTNAVNSSDNTSLNTQNLSTNKSEIQNVNNASVSQDMNGYANTGYNEASRNVAIGGNAGLIQTGNAYIVTLLQSAANRNAAQ